MSAGRALAGAFLKRLYLALGREGFELIGGQRVAKEITLKHSAAKLVKFFDLFVFFNSFGNNLKSHILTQAYQISNKVECTGTVEHGADKRSVNLDDIYR